MTPIWLAIATIAANAIYLPSAHDKHGWALRVRIIEIQPLYLAQEYIGYCETEVALINRSSATRSHMPLVTSAVKKDLRVSLERTDGKPINSPTISGGSSFRAVIPKVLPQLASGEINTFRFTASRGGFYTFSQSGDYELRATLKTDEGKIEAPPIKFAVIEPNPDDILVSKSVAIEGEMARWPKEKQERGFIQQIEIGSRTWLFYRRYYSQENSGSINSSHRIAELPGKVLDLKVEGAYGSWNPLTITYRAASFSKFSTIHIINPVDGRPWTAEEEKQRQEKLKREGKPAPPPDK